MSCNIDYGVDVAIPKSMSLPHVSTCNRLSHGTNCYCVSNV